MSCFVWLGFQASDVDTFYVIHSWNRKFGWRSTHTCATKILDDCSLKSALHRLSLRVSSREYTRSAPVARPAEGIRRFTLPGTSLVGTSSCDYVVKPLLSVVEPAPHVIHPVKAVVLKARETLLTQPSIYHVRWNWLPHGKVENVNYLLARE